MSNNMYALPCLTINCSLFAVSFDTSESVHRMMDVCLKNLHSAQNRFIYFTFADFRYSGTRFSTQELNLFDLK